MRSVAEGIKVSCGQMAGVGASTFSDTIDSFWFKDEVSDAFLPSNLLVRSHTALGLILLKSVNVCCTCSWAKPDYYN